MLMKRVTLFVVTLFFCAQGMGFSQSAEMREIRVKAAVTTSYQSFPAWKSEFERRLAYASRIFESEFKIKFKVVSYLQWEPSDEKKDIETLLEELRNTIPRDDADLVIGLAHVKKSPDIVITKDLHTIGQARPFSGHIVIRYPMDKLYKVQEETVMVHELGHLFGAVHTDDPKSIMSPVVDRQLPVRFDQENYQIIQQTRALNFQQGAEALPTQVLEPLLRSYLKMIRKNDSADFFFSIGLFYLQLGQPNDALKAWKKAVSLDGASPELHYNLGGLYFKLKQQDNAITELSRAASGLDSVGSRAMKASASKMLGQAYFEKENMFAAYRFWTAASKLDPNDLEIVTDLAMVSFKQGQISEAIKSFENVVAQEPANVKALTYLGKGLDQTGKPQEGLQYLELALASLNREPKSESKTISLALIYVEIGKIKLKLNKKNEAYENFQVACDLSPSLECHKNLGQAFFQNQQWDGAIKEFSAIIQVKKDDLDTYGMLGIALTQKGDLPNALGVFREALKYAQEPLMQSQLHRNIGNLFLLNKNYDLAAPEFNLALSKEWGNVENHFGLAVSLLGKQESIAAINSLRDVLRIDPNNQRAKSMLSSIQSSLNSENS